eukprot:2959992-Pleurochrysis_carterae.AAC.2
MSRCFLLGIGECPEIHVSVGEKYLRDKLMICVEADMFWTDKVCLVPCIQSSPGRGCGFSAPACQPPGD